MGKVIRFVKRKIIQCRINKLEADYIDLIMSNYPGYNFEKMSKINKLGRKIDELRREYVELKS